MISPLMYWFSRESHRNDEACKEEDDPHEIRTPIQNYAGSHSVFAWRSRKASISLITTEQFMRALHAGKNLTSWSPRTLFACLSKRTNSLSSLFFNQSSSMSNGNHCHFGAPMQMDQLPRFPQMIKETSMQFLSSRVRCIFSCCFFICSCIYLVRRQI